MTLHISIENTSENTLSDRTFCIIHVRNSDSNLQCVTLLVRHTKSHITDKQLQVLLGYAEEDIYDSLRQATAFGLLKVSPNNKCFFNRYSSKLKWCSRFSYELIFYMIKTDDFAQPGFL